MPILKMEHITKKFVGTVALQDVSIELQVGEILAILGENGAGKSTLMKILSGNYPCQTYDGSIVLEESPCRFTSTRDAQRAGIGMIHQEISLELDLSITENVLLGNLPVKRSGLIDWKKAHAFVQEIMARLNVTGIDVKTTVRNLSASMQQLVSIARALHRNPKILILDEPTASLTETETQNLFSVIRSLKQQGISCLYISHKLNEIFDLCDRVHILRDGKSIREYPKNAFDNDKIIEDIVGSKIKRQGTGANKAIGEEVLRVEHFKVQHPYSHGKSIIEDVSFSLRKGEILGLCGLVGSGRSELLGAIFDSTRKLYGDVYLHGKKVQINSPADAKRNGLGMLTEDRKKDGFVPSMNVRENTTLTILRQLSRLFLLDGKKEQKIVDNYTKMLRIKAPSTETPITSLSGGNQQKIILAKWLATNLDILFLDEPTRGIDVGTKAELYALIGMLAAKGLAVVVISSEFEELMQICDRFLVLYKGRVRKELDKAEASDAMLLQYCSDLS